MAMQRIQTFFADLSQKAGLADEIIRLSPRRHRARAEVTQPIQRAARKPAAISARVRPSRPTKAPRQAAPAIRRFR